MIPPIKYTDLAQIALRVADEFPEQFRNAGIEAVAGRLVALAGRPDTLQLVWDGRAVTVTVSFTTPDGGSCVGNFELRSHHLWPGVTPVAEADVAATETAHA